MTQYPISAPIRMSKSETVRQSKAARVIPSAFGLRHALSLLFSSIGLLTAPQTQAQWVTQSFTVKPGWNAVYLHVDASHVMLDDLITGAGNPITEVWLWQPPSRTLQFVASPQAPVAANSQWAVWDRDPQITDSLVKLIGNSACLVYNSGSSDFVWNVQGRPVPPRHEWTSTGLNLLGFSTPPGDAPDFDAFLLPCPEFQRTAEIYRYPGGELSEIEPRNPRQVFPPVFRNTPVNRGEAFWIRSGDTYNRYFGPFELTSTGDEGVNFSGDRSVASLRLRNHTAGELTVTLEHLASEAAPAGQTVVAGSLPLLIRGARNPVNLAYVHTELPVGGSHAWTLKGAGQPGSDVEVVIGLNRSAITENPGDLLAGLLRLTDSAGHLQVELAASAVVSSPAGLWVGGATVTQVGHSLKSYAKDADGNFVTSTDEATFGSYIVTGNNTTLGAVARPYPLRLIVHNPDPGQPARLFQQIYLGLDANTNAVTATRQAALNPELVSHARRITATHLPWSAANPGWPFDFNLGDGAPLTATVALEFDDTASNPFVHTYHPDHDNLGPRFQTPLNRGQESYTIRRTIQLTPAAPSADFQSLTTAGRRLGGVYRETIEMVGLQRATGPGIKTFEIQGYYELNRIDSVPDLTSTP